MKWSEHRHAPRYLAGMSFAESSFFPVPVDVMLAPMALARPEKAWHFAFIATTFSVLGGTVGYFAGYFAMDLLEPWIKTLGYWPRYQQIIAGFNEWGIWIIFIAGVSPIPYKLFTITAGALSMALLPFISSIENSIDNFCRSTIEDSSMIKFSKKAVLVMFLAEYYVRNVFLMI